MSMRPGVTTRPSASMTLSAFSVMLSATAATLPSFTKTSRMASTPFLGSTTLPPLMRSVDILFSCKFFHFAVNAVTHQPEQGLAYRHAIFNLLEDMGLFVDRGEG